MENLGNGKITQLANDMSLSDVTAVVVSSTGWPAAEFRILIDSELMLVASKGSGDERTWTVTRGIEGTTIAAHSAGASVYQPLTAGGLIKIIEDRLPAAVQLSTKSGQLMELDGTKLYVDGFACAPYGGVALWEDFIGDESAIAPVYDCGDYMFLGQALFKRVAISLNEEAFFYVAEKDLEFESTNIDLSAAVNDSTDVKLIGHASVAGDAVRWAPITTVTAEIEADGDLAGVTMFLYTSTVRIYSAHAIPRVLPSGQGTKAIYELTIVPNADTPSSQVTLGKVSDATGYTSLPKDSAIMDMNTLGNVGFPLYIQFPSAGNNLHITSAKITVKVPKPVKNRAIAGTTYRLPEKQPFVAADYWNKPLTTGAVIQPHQFTDNPASTGTSESTGTLNASGTAGSDIITVYNNANVTVGSYVLVGTVNRNKGASLLGTTEIWDDLTYNYFGVGVKVQEILPSNQIRLTAAVKMDFTRRGITGTGVVRGLIFSPSAINVSMMMSSAQGNTAAYSIQTGKQKLSESSKVSAKAYGDKAAIVRKVKKSDPICQWTAGVVTWNPWTMKVTEFTSDTGGEKYTGLKYFMRTPDVTPFPTLDTSARNKDCNFCIISENGIYSHDSTRTIKTTVNGVSSYTCSRAAIKDLTGKAVPDILQRGHLADSLSNSTRMTGDTPMAGLIRAHEVAKIIPATDTTTINPSTGVPYTLAEKINIAYDAIPHEVLMVLSQLQLMSEYYAPNVADQTQAGRVSFYSYFGQQERNRPVVASATGTHAVGDVWQLKDGTYLEPMSVIVEAVDAAGLPTKLFVGNCGQYYTRPTGDGNALVMTKMSGTGTTLSIDVLGLAGMTDTDTIAEAFPETWFRSVAKWPSPSRDAGYDAYSGSIQPGATFTISRLRDIKQEFTDILTANPSSGFNLYYMAVLAAIQKYGIRAVDLAKNTNHIVVMEWDIDTTTFNSLCYETGNFLFTGCKYIKGQLVAVENLTPTMKGGVGTLLAAAPTELFPRSA